MGDIFNEQLVEKSNSLKDNLIRVAIIIGAIVLIMVCSMVPVLVGFLIPIALVIIFGAVFLMRRLNVEFEYIFTSGDLDIDKIFNKNKRKKFISIDVRKIEIMAPVNSKDHASELSNYEKVIDCSSGTNNNNTYAAMIVRNGKREKLILEPNEKMLKAIKKYIPRKIMQY
ncbi:DUF6106 family protein [Vallitalea guaymasensis]|uniref:Uncharacterized protein n=1 Tax=Vallitalea guaymasensis TaxID=1185412 RepID=A0A8J8M7J7_9FIRM|nr:DUF6106 family protein [Vallitalea guaymasensis]QUH27585.1 hypothetical protein HYG85_01085 [Vallitalea guaymasensis]